MLTRFRLTLAILLLFQFFNVQGQRFRFDTFFVFPFMQSYKVTQPLVFNSEQSFNTYKVKSQMNFVNAFRYYLPSCIGTSASVHYKKYYLKLGANIMNFETTYKIQSLFAPEKSEIVVQNNNIDFLASLAFDFYAFRHKELLGSPESEINRRLFVEVGMAYSVPLKVESADAKFPLNKLVNTRPYESIIIALGTRLGDYSGVSLRYSQTLKSMKNGVRVGVYELVVNTDALRRKRKTNLYIE